MSLAIDEPVAVVCYRLWDCQSHEWLLRESCATTKAVDRSRPVTVVRDGRKIVDNRSRTTRNTIDMAKE